MDPIRLKMTAAALAAVAVAATVLVAGGGRGPAPALEAGDPLLADRLAAALEAPPTPPAPLVPARARAAARTPPAGAEETAAAIAAATRLALAEIAAAPAAPSLPERAPPPAEATGFRPVAEAAAPAFVISAADAWTAADQGWAAASGLAPAMIEPGPRPRRP